MARRLVACLAATVLLFLCSVFVTQSGVAAPAFKNPDELILKEPPIPGSETVEPTNFDSGLNWSMYKGSKGCTGYTDEKLHYPLKLSWKFLAQIYSNNPSSPAVADGVVYFCTGRRIYAVNTATGTLRWHYPKFSPLTSVIKSSPLVGENLVYFGGGDGRLYAIKKSSGDLAWTFMTDGTMSSSPIMSNGVIYVGSTDNNLYALDAESGDLVWTSGFKTRDSITSPPAVFGGAVYFVSNDSVLYAANAGSGRVKWTVKTGAGMKCYGPVASDNAIYLAVGSTLQSFQAQSGRLNWAVRLESDIISTPSVANGRIFVTCKDSKLYSINTAGKVRWNLPIDLGARSYGGTVIADDTVIVCGDRGTLMALDANTGEIKWDYIVQPSITMIGKLKYVNLASPPAISNGVLYVLADDGALHAFSQSAPDNEPPDVTRFVPSRNILIPGEPPIEIAALVNDIGSGINPDSIVLSLDNVPVKHEYKTKEGLIWYRTPYTKPVVDLPDGRHAVKLSLEDWAGNVSVTEWSFQVDNRLKYIPRLQPAAPGAGAPGAPRKPGAPGAPGPGPSLGFEESEKPE